ncbi:MAG: ATP-binding protein [Treponema sp.]|nr:ATP-binding protein [Treponema sp.]
MPLDAAHRGYMYQDILSAYFVAHEIALENLDSKFIFDKKKTPQDVPDKFDDITIYRKNETSFYQVKYSDSENEHSLEKEDFSTVAKHDLALWNLFASWKELKSENSKFYVLLSWQPPLDSDKICDVIEIDTVIKPIFPNAICYRFNIDKLWPEATGVISSWRSLKSESLNIDRYEFKKFLASLSIQLKLPKLSYSLTDGLEKELCNEIEKIGIGIYPNERLKIEDVAYSFWTYVIQERSKKHAEEINSLDFCKRAKIELDHGAIPEDFIIDKKALIKTDSRLNQIKTGLSKSSRLVVTGEPGTGKSWLIENLKSHLSDTTIIRHYCYTSLSEESEVFKKRVSKDAMIGSLIAQLEREIGRFEIQEKKYASDINSLNERLNQVDKKVLLIIDGIDHVWRTYQRVNGYLSEKEETILEIINKISSTNPNVSILVLSQPIDQLSLLTTFDKIELVPIDESFVIQSLQKQKIKNVRISETSLSRLVLQKSNGNALYCKYIIDSIAKKIEDSERILNDFPAYDNNLKNYYTYLVSTLRENDDVCYILCGADYSFSKKELEDITGNGEFVTETLSSLSPVLRFSQNFGYSIYHESFKRFLINHLQSKGIDINKKVYKPLIEWYKEKNFFEDNKSYCHLLKLYWEVQDYKSILDTIDFDFISKSLFFGRPLKHISNNIFIQSASLEFGGSLEQCIIINEQKKDIDKFDYIDPDIWYSYCRALKTIYGQSCVDQFLWNEKKDLLEIKDLYQIYTKFALDTEDETHWDLFPKVDLSNNDKLIPNIAIKLLDLKIYNRFDELSMLVFKKCDYETIDKFENAVEWWCLKHGTDWKSSTKKYLKEYNKRRTTTISLHECIKIITCEKFHYSDDWKIYIDYLPGILKRTSPEEIQIGIESLENYNWFRNWVIYYIKLCLLEEREYSFSELMNAFGYLVKDRDHFKGTPRTCDLYKQTEVIHQSIHRGLLLCKNKDEQRKCCELLSQLINLTTSFQGSRRGPLTNDAYLDIISEFSGNDFILSKYENVELRNGLYDYSTKHYFDLCFYLLKDNKFDEGIKAFNNGIRTFLSNGNHKDRNLSNLLDCANIYNARFNSLDNDFWFDLYDMAYAVQCHTDRSDTSDYPTEVFKEYCNYNRGEALKLLITQLINHEGISGYLEEDLIFILQNYSDYFNADEWYFILRTMPSIFDEDIILKAFNLRESISENFRSQYDNWLRSRPFCKQDFNKNGFSQQFIEKYSSVFNIDLPLETKETYPKSSFDDVEIPFNASNTNEALDFFDKNYYRKGYEIPLIDFLRKQPTEDRKNFLFPFLLKNSYSGREMLWISDLFEENTDEWIYSQVMMFLFSTDGWSKMITPEFLKVAYQKNPGLTKTILKESLCKLVANYSYYSWKLGCNLVIGLCEAGIEKDIIEPLFNILKKFVEYRLPDRNYDLINQDVLKALDGFSSHELVYSLLISRLTTLTTEKTQNILFSISNLLLSDKKSFIKPVVWALTENNDLYPLHRALLLQFILENNITLDATQKEKLKKLYPTEYYLENLYLENIVDCENSIISGRTTVLEFKESEDDKKLLYYINPNYIYLAQYVDIYSGSYSLFSKMMKEQSDFSREYFIKYEKLFVRNLISLNCLYKIVNKYHKKQLEEASIYLPCVQFMELDTNLLNCIQGALSIRPSYLVTPEKIYSNPSEKCVIDCPEVNWEILAFSEHQIIREDYKTKKYYSMGAFVKTDNRELFNSLKFNLELYFNNSGNDETKNTNPIMYNVFKDDLEWGQIFFISPFIIKSMNLQISTDFENGLRAINKSGEEIIKFIQWKEEYFGSASDGLEYPKKIGQAVLIRKDKLKALFDLYNNELEMKGFALPADDD